MNKRLLLVGIVVLAVLSLAIGVTEAQEKSYSADRFDVQITVEEDGSVLVTETTDFNFVGGPFTFVFREIPTDHTDGVSVLEASVDGVAYAIGENPGQVEIDAGNPLRITWHLEPTSNSAHSFGLTYRAAGVARQEVGTDALYWQALPDSYEYQIGESRTVIGYPATAEMIAEPAVLTGPAIVTQSSQNQVSFLARNLQPDTPLVFKLAFAEGSLISAPPNWQVEQQAAVQRRAAQNAQVPYWIGLAVLLFVGGLIIMAVYYRRHSSPAVKSKLTRMIPPSDLPPGTAGALLSQGAPTWSHAQGTMFSLAERGVLIIEELPEKAWYRKYDFVVKHIDFVPGLRPHEEGFLDMLFDEKEGRTTTIKLSDMGKKINGTAWKKYKEALQDEMERDGYINKSRQKSRTTMFVFAGILLAVGLIGTIVLAIFSGMIGAGPLILMAAMAFLGLAGIFFGSALSPLTDAGSDTAVAWKEFSNYLKDVSKGKQAVDNPAMFEKYLPYAAAFGLLQKWAKHFEKEGWTETPGYFHALPSTRGNQAMVAFVAMSAATHSSGGSAAGAGGAGAGAAGGGASGAG